MISDRYLADLAARAPADGRFTEAEQAALAMALPDIAAELLRRRGTDSPAARRARAEVIDLTLQAAYRAIRAPDPMPEEIARACRIILTHGHDPLQVQAAREMLKSMGAAA